MTTHTARRPNPKARQAWMAEFEKLTGVGGSKPQDFWDTATYLFNQGLSAREAADKYSKSHKQGSFRSDILRIASKLPEGDPTRRAILAAVSKGAAAWWMRGVQEWELRWPSGRKTVSMTGTWEEAVAEARRLGATRLDVQGPGYGEWTVLDPRTGKSAALSDNVNVRLMERDIHEFIDNKLRVLEGAEERDLSSAATQARIAVAQLLRYL